MGAELANVGGAGDEGSREEGDGGGGDAGRVGVAVAAPGQHVGRPLAVVFNKGPFFGQLKEADAGAPLQISTQTVTETLSPVARKAAVAGTAP